MIHFAANSLSTRSPKASGPLCNALTSLLSESGAMPPVRKVGAPPQDPLRPNADAVAASHYPTRSDEPVDWSQPLYDSEGFEHRLVELGGVQVVTRISFAFAIWDRKSLTLVGPDVGEVQTIGNTPLSAEERERRRVAAQLLLEDLRVAPSEPNEPDVTGAVPRG